MQNYKENESYEIRKRINYKNLLENRKKWKATKTKVAGLSWFNDKTRRTYTMDEQNK